MYDTDVFRYGYTSLTTPSSTLEISLATKASTLLKRRPAPGYNAEEYASSRIWATAADGTKVPVSIFHKKDRKNEPAPFLLYGYGSYGSSYDVYYNSRWLSLLDRGFAVGIAHIRGGGEFGRGWKLKGKFEHKMNSFTDFIACAETLIQEKWTTPEKLAIEGRSAGGLLMGGVMNMRPDLFGAVIAGVAFVDVINTLLDETIPLTVIEWEEWGNPQNAEQYRWIRPYSPYDNITAQAYPNALFLAGLNDPRVGYWEPAKFVAKLRQNRTNDNFLFLKTDMGSGHGGASGRYGQLRDDAFEYAFVLKALGLTESESDKLEPLRSVWAENGTFCCVAEGLNGICKRRLALNQLFDFFLGNNGKVQVGTGHPYKYSPSEFGLTVDIVEIVVVFTEGPGLR